jgi:hypothetical protein
VDPAHYDGWSGDLIACENDATDMMAIAMAQGFDARKILTRNATRRALLDGIAHAAARVTAGDIFLLTFSGHGGYLDDQNGEEEDGQDETLCLYDGELIDDELYRAFGAFAAGVRILVVSDSCHSGTVVWFTELLDKGAIEALAPQLRDAVTELAIASTERCQRRARYMPADVGARVYQRNKAFYDAITSDPALADAQGSVVASVILLSGCQDDQESMDGNANGVFTGALKTAWANGAFAGGYADFISAIADTIADQGEPQVPGWIAIGAVNPNFEAQRPFSV